MARETDNLGRRVRTFARSLYDSRVAEKTTLADQGMIGQFNKLLEEARELKVDANRLPDPAVEGKDSFASIYMKSRLLAQALPLDFPLPLLG